MTFTAFLIGIVVGACGSVLCILLFDGAKKPDRSDDISTETSELFDEGDYV